MGPTQRAVLIMLLTVFVAPGARAADQPSEAHAFIEAGTARGTTLGIWEFRQSYSVSLLHLGAVGQGLGARLTLLPPSDLAGPWELSADAVIRFANEGPLYFKPIGGVAVASSGGLWPPRIRVGTEVGLAAVHGAFGIEAGIAALCSFPPSRALEGEWVVSAGIGILFGFGASSPVPVASRRNDRADERPSSSVNPVVGAVLRATPVGGGFNTCEGSRATPQCLQAMSEGTGAASTRATSPPTPGATTSTAAPAGGAASTTAPSTVPSAAPRSPSLWKSLATAVGAALGVKSDEERAEEAEHARLMMESGRVLEELRRQAHEPSSGPDAARGVKPEASTQADKDGEQKKLGRIYVTYTKLNLKTNRYYVGRTSMVLDLKKPLLVQAQTAMDIRNANHHIDESDEPQDPTFRQAELDEFDVGTAVNYEKRYSDLAYLRIRGREQQIIDFHGGAQSDTGKPYRTENALRGGAKDNPRGRLFHDAATAKWGQFHRYTGN